MLKIKISDDFSETPGGRLISEGPFSGELFRKEILEPMYHKCVETGDTLEVDFDGTFGYATSFLEESFGGLVRIRKEKGILKNIHIISLDDVTVPELIEKYVKKAEAELQ